MSIPLALGIVAVVNLLLGYALAICIEKGTAEKMPFTETASLPRKRLFRPNPRFRPN